MFSPVFAMKTHGFSFNVQTEVSLDFHSSTNQRLAVAAATSLEVLERRMLENLEAILFGIWPIPPTSGGSPAPLEVAQLKVGVVDTLVVAPAVLTVTQLHEAVVDRQVVHHAVPPAGAAAPHLGETLLHRPVDGRQVELLAV